MNTKRLAVVTLMGVIAFVSKGFLPSPFDKMFIVIEAIVFALSSLVFPKLGAFYASFVNGLLLTLLRVGFFPFSFLFSLMFGFLTDGLVSVFKVKVGSNVKKAPLISAVTLSTAITGVASMYLTSLAGLVLMSTSLYIGILAGGIVSGAVAGYSAFLIWNKRLSKLF